MCDYTQTFVKGNTHITSHQQFILTTIAFSLTINQLIMIYLIVLIIIIVSLCDNNNNNNLQF